MAEGWEVRGPVRREPMPQVRVGPPFPEGEEAGTPAYELNLEEAQDAEELHAIYRDLEFVISTGDYLVRMMEQRERQTGQATSVGTASFLERALYIAAVITYMRCFGTGKREYRLDESIFTGDAEHLLENHQYYRDIRNKHLAHSVNAFEITKAVAWVEGLDTEEPDVRSVGVVHVTRSTDHVDDVRRMVRLAVYVQTIVYGRLDRANQKLSERVHNLSTSELKKLKQMDLAPQQGPVAAATPREY